MKKNQILKSRYIPYILLVLITFLIGFPLLRERMLEGHDGVFQLFRNYTTKIAIEDKQLIPMVNPDMMGGFGYASNMFYGVLTTYITSFISIFTPTIGSAVNLFILLTVFLSGLFMYTFVKDISEKKTGALLAAVTYMTAPYFLYDIYVRMALGEIASFVFLPLLFHGLYNIIHDRKQKWYLLTIGTAGLFLSHSISTLMAAIFAFFYLLLNYKKVCNKEVLKKISFSLLFAVFISLPTVLPLMEARFSSDYMVFDSAYMKTTGMEMEHNAISLCGSSSKAITGIAKGYFIAVITGFMLSLYLKRKKTSGTQHTQFGILTLISFVSHLISFHGLVFPAFFLNFNFHGVFCNYPASFSPLL